MGRNKMKKYLILFAALTLTACGHMIAEMNGITVVNPKDAGAVIQHTKIDYDQHKNLTTVAGPAIFAQNNLFGHRYLLRTWQKGKSIKDFQTAQLYIIAALDDWYFLDTAYSNGKKLKLAQISRDVGSCSSSGGCTVSETVGISLTRQEVIALSKSAQNYDVKISGNKGSITLSIPAAYFSGVLMAYPSLSN